MKKKDDTFRTTIRYEPEADVLSWEVSADRIADAAEVGNLIVHFNKQREPVYVEMLGARSFIEGTLPMVREKIYSKHVSVARQ